MQTYKQTHYKLTFSDKGTNDISKNLNIIMNISRDQSLLVFLDSFHSFYIFGVQKKNQHWLKNIFGCIFIKLKCRCLPTGPGDLKTSNI